MPQANPEGYAAQDAVPRLGTQSRGVPFELMLYPGRRHGVRGHERQLQRWRTYLDFLDRTISSRALE